MSSPPVVDPVANESLEVAKQSLEVANYYGSWTLLLTVIGIALIILSMPTKDTVLAAVIAFVQRQWRRFRPAVHPNAPDGSGAEGGIGLDTHERDLQQEEENIGLHARLRDRDLPLHQVTELVRAIQLLVRHLEAQQQTSSTGAFSRPSTRTFLSMSTQTESESTGVQTEPSSSGPSSSQSKQALQSLTRTSTNSPLTSAVVPQPSRIPLRRRSSIKPKKGDQCHAFVQNAFCSATVAFVGPVHFAPEGIYVGVILDQPKGDSDGWLRGHQYFSCKPGYGAFFDFEQFSSKLLFDKDA